MYLQSSLALTVAAISGLLVPLGAEAVAHHAEGTKLKIEVTATETPSLKDRYSMYYMAGEGGEGAEGGEGCEEGGEGGEGCEGGEGGEGGEEEETVEETDGDG